MQRIVFVFGAISGAFCAAVFILGANLAIREGHVSGAWGFLLMLVALSVIFFGIKRYRDSELGGVIRFGQAFLVGLGISLVAGVTYVTVWEIYLASTGYTFMDDYFASYIKGKEAAGVAGEELEAIVTQMEAMKERASNPLMRVFMSFLEIVPFGLIVSLISAALLRNSKVLPAHAAANNR